MVMTMATTKIWAIKDSLSRVVNYAKNPEKTIFSDLKQVLKYAENDEKTIDKNEKTMYVTGVNCNRETAYEEMKMELDRRQQNPTLLESLQDYYDKKTQNSPKLSNFYAEMERRGKKISNLQEFAKSINYLQVHNIETMDDLQTRIQELNGIISASKAEISEKREQL